MIWLVFDRIWKLAPLPAFLFVVAFVVTGRTVAQTVGEDTSPNKAVYRISVGVEVVDVQVLDRHSQRAVRSLKREDFQVYEDKIAQEITSFSSGDETPLSLVLLFDLTDSVRPVLQSLAEGALEILAHLKPEEDVAVMVYASSAQLLQDFTTDRTVAAAAIARASRMKSGEAAFFNEGIFQAAARLGRARKPATRPVIIWLTDDVPNIPSEEIRMRYGRSIAASDLHTEKDAMREVLKTGTVVCTLLLRSDISDREGANRSTQKIIDSMLYPPGTVYNYARATGGEVIESSRKKLKIRLADLIDDLRSRYALSYHPSAVKPRGAFCDVRIRLSPDAARAYGKPRIAAKMGYFR